MGRCSSNLRLRAVGRRGPNRWERRLTASWPLLHALLVVFWSLASFGIEPRDFAVEVTAQVEVIPPRIHLRWPEGHSATGYTISRKVLQSGSWSPLASLPGPATGYTDNAVVLGAAYEYEIAQQNPDGITAYGYVLSGIEVPFQAYRGRVILIVDGTYATELTAELDQLKRDLIGDGWFVLRHTVARNSSPEEVKGLIRSEYNADPGNTRAVFLFGHVPVPYSGVINPDMHTTHLGAWPADVYYGDMQGQWTDHSARATDAEDSRNHNVPGDGKFDQSEPTAPIMLQVGRVDLYDLPAFAPLTELDLLRRYLNKNHEFRHGLIRAERRGLIRDNFGEIQGDAPATDAWRSFTAFFGPDAVYPIGPGEFFPTLESQSYLWAYGGGGGGYLQADGVGSTTDFAQRQPRAVFFMLHGSYFGDWDFPDSFLRAAIASPGYGLAAAWTGLPHWFLHPMALGETIGQSALMAQNNREVYKNHVNLSSAQVHIALMGDPTLRMHIVAPPVDLRAVRSGEATVTLNWAPSADQVQGYYVYRAASAAGPFSRLTRSFVSNPPYVDGSAPDGQSVYMVRAVKLETTASGSFYNPSQGAFAIIDGGGGPVLPTVQIEATKPDASEEGPEEGAFVLSRTGATDAPLSVSFVISGTAQNGVDYEPIGQSVVIPAGFPDAWVSIQPLADDHAEGDEEVILTLVASSAYNLGSSTGATVMLHDRPVLEPPLISSIEIGDTVMIQFGGPPQRAFTVESSSDLQVWSAVGSGVSGPGKVTTFTDLQSQKGIGRFYRVRWD